MQDDQMDDMDELIREASKSHHPVYDDKAWEKMQALLDQHLPVKKDRRKPVLFFLLSLLLISGAAFWMIQHQSTGTKEKVVAGKNVPAKKLLSKAGTGKNSNTGPFDTASPNNSQKKTAIFRGSRETTVPENFKKSFAGNHLSSGRKHFLINSSGGETGFSADGNTVEMADIFPEKTEENMNAEQPGVAGSLAEKPNALNIDSIVQIAKERSAGTDSQNIAKIATSKAATPEQTPDKPTKKPVAKKGFANNFAINLSAGPDLSFVNLAATNKTRLNYGIGLTYTFANRLTIRSGFYVARKTYAAKADNYHPPAWYWTNNADLKSLIADCKIYEVPLAASYNFKQAKNHNWFAGVGFSSFLMKRETYNYSYKDAWGQPMNKSWTLLNGGNQYFSVFTVSGGYQYNFNRNLSILAEPYFKLPLQGIGFGKIKLNSGGLLFTLRVKPFAKTR